MRHGSLLLDRETRPPSDLDYLRPDPDMPNPSAEPVLSMVPRPFSLYCDSWRAELHTGQALSAFPAWAHQHGKEHRRCGCAQALTQFHVLLLSARSLHLVSRVSGRSVQEVPLSSLGGAYAQPSAHVASLALLRDAETSTIYLAAGVRYLGLTCRTFTCPTRPIMGGTTFLGFASRAHAAWVIMSCAGDCLVTLASH